MCNCGCNTCETKGPLLTEGKVKSLLSEGLQYHIDKKIPLFETVYRIGSDKHLALIKEARKMYSRNVIDLCEDDEALIKTHLGEFGIYEGEAVPLDLPMLEQTYSGFLRNPEDPDSEKFEPTGSVAQFKEDLRALFGKFKGDLKNPEFIKGVAQIMVNWKSLLRSQLNESKYDTEETIQQTIDRLKARIKDPKDGGNVPFLVQKIKDLEKLLNEYQGDGTNKISDDKLGRLIPKLPKGYVGKNTGIGEYTISTPDGEDIVLTQSKDKKNWSYEPSNVALKILNEFSLPKFDVVKPIIDKFLGGVEKAGKKLLEVVKREGKQTLVLVKEIAEYVISGEKPNPAEEKKINKQLLDLGFLALLGITGNIPVSIVGILYWILKESGVAKEFLKLDENILTEKKAKKKKKDPPIGKPKRGGPKAYYVYVRDPKTKKIKKVTFGSGGLKAKIRNKKARNAFAARHDCKNKKDRTKASYWSCNLPRYAPALGLGAKMNTFW